MAERSIKVRLQAEVADFNRQIQNSARTLGDFEKSAKSLGGASDTTMGRLVQSAKINRQEWSAVGGVLTTAGGAITAIGAAALTTGIKYNTLQQTSRAALTTIFKDGEKANQQMDRLDAFASTSPFAKDVFIRAQQQMLGFGIEAQKVIPYLDSIQNAVAATGGSNQDIEELTRIFSQIRASAKITATDLMQFGKRGIDAAGLIGEAMGKTGAEIREEITAGTLDAGVALDALAAGMVETYDGAAAGVKNTLEGAIDRVKAAWRDLSSELAAPLVGTEGGGLGIAALNTLADAMRQFQSAPTWVKGGVAAIGRLTGAVALTGGTMMLAVPKWLQFRESVATLSETHPLLGKFDSALGRVGKTLGKAAIWGAAAVTLGHGLTAIANSARPAAAGVSEVELALRQGAGLDVAFSHLTGHYSDLSNAFDVLTSNSPGDWIDRQMSALNQVFGGPLPDDVKGAADAFNAVGQALASMVSAGDVEFAATQFEELAHALNLSEDEYEALLDLMPAYREALAQVAIEQEKSATSAGGLADGLGEVPPEVEAAAEALEKWFEIVHDASSSFIDLLGGYQSIIDKNKEIAQSTADATDSSKDSWEDYYDGVTVSMQDYLTALEEQVAAQQDWQINMLLLSGRVSDGLKQHLLEMGDDGAALVADLVNASDDEIQRLEAVFGQAASEATTAFGDNLLEAGPVMEAIMATAGTDAARAAAEAIANGELTIQEAIEQYDLTAYLELNGDIADLTFAQMAAEWDQTVTSTNLDADTTLADGAFAAATAGWDDTLTSTKLGLDDTRADAEFARLTDNWESELSYTGLGMIDTIASVKFKEVTKEWSTTTTDTNLDLNATPAQIGLSNFLHQLPDSHTIQLRTSGSIGGGGSLYRDALYSGGFVKGLAAGGTVPGPRAGRDNIGWPLISQGQLLTQPLEGGEFVVRSSQAVKYEPQLRAMNAGTYRPGLYQDGSVSGVTPAEGPQGVSVSDLDYIADRIARQMVSASRGAGSAAYVSASDYTNQLFRDAAVVRR